LTGVADIAVELTRIVIIQLHLHMTLER